MKKRRCCHGEAKRSFVQRIQTRASDKGRNEEHDKGYIRVHKAEEGKGMDKEHCR